MKIIQTRSYLQFLIALAFTIYQLFIQLSTGVLLQSVSHELDLALTDIGLLSSSFYFSYILFQIPSNLLIHFLGPRKIIALGAALCSLGLMILAESHTLWHAILGRMISGMGASCAFGTLVYVCANQFKSSQLAKLLGWSETFMMLGTWLSENSLSYLVNATAAWRLDLMYASLIGITLAILSLLFIDDNKYNQFKRTALSLNEFILLFKSKHLWLNGIYIGLLFSPVTVIASTWSIPFLVQVQHVSNQQALFEASFTYIGLALASPFISQIYHHRYKNLLCVFMLVTLLLLCLLFIARINSAIFYVTVFSILGITSSITVLNYTWVQNNFSAQFGSLAIGFTNTIALTMIPLLNLFVMDLVLLFAHQYLRP